MKSWLAKKLGFDDNAAGFIAPGEGNLSGLNLKEALDAHAEWKNRLQTEIDGLSTNAPLDVSLVASDCQCTLGKWLHGTGKKKFARLPEYKKALKAHASFHISAAEVVIEYQSGNTEQAKKLLSTSFREASNNNQLELVRLFSAAKK